MWKARDTARPAHSIPPIPEGAPSGPPQRPAEFRAAILPVLATPHSARYCPPPARLLPSVQDRFSPKPRAVRPREHGATRPYPTRPNVWRSGGLRDHRYAGRRSQCGELRAPPPPDRSHRAAPAHSPDEPAHRLQQYASRRSYYALPLYVSPYRPSHDHLIQRIFDDALSIGLLQLRNQRPGGALLDDRIHRDPLAIGQWRDGRILQRRQESENRRQVRFTHVEHQTHPPQRSDSPTQHDSQILNLLPPRRIGPSRFVRD